MGTTSTSTTASTSKPIAASDRTSRKPSLVSNEVNEGQGESDRQTTPFTTTSTTEKGSQAPEDEPRSADFSHLNSASCGTQTKLSLRVTFGRSALGGQFPWAASLQYRRKPGGRGIPLCG